MTTNKQHAAVPLTGGGYCSHLVSGMVAAVIAMMLMFSASAMAAPPPANAVIGNQAVATYNDASGAAQTTLSNLVQTTVLPVGAFTLTPDVDKTILAGQTAYMPHILTNNGNVPDVFDLTLNGISHNLVLPYSIKIYADKNGDGMPDDLNAPLCTATPADGAMTTSPATCKTASVPGGGTAYNLVVAVQSASGNAGDAAKLWEKYTLTATAETTAIYTTLAQTVTDSVRIDTGAIFDVTKAIDIPGGPASSADCTVSNIASCTSPKVAKYTLTYTNRGGATGTVQIQDLIGSGATVGMAYVPGTAVWSNGGTLTDAAIVPATADATDSTGANIYYEGLSTSATLETINAFVTGVKPNATASVTFTVLVLNTAKVGTSTTTNTAQFAVTSAAPSTAPSAPANNSNPASYIVGLGQLYNVVANNNTTANTDEPADAQSGVNIVTQPTAAAGQTITFNNIVWNTGDGTDSFDVQMRPDLVNTFPVGTSFQLFKSDGINPLLDTSGNGIPDTGPILAGKTTSYYTVIVKATIPLNACTLTAAVGSGGTNSCAAGNGPYTVAKVATSVGDPTKSNKVFDQLTTITKDTVDLQNAAGAGSGPGLSADGLTITSTVITAQTNIVPGVTTYFDLPVFNTSSIADSYVYNYDVETTSLSGQPLTSFVDGKIPSDWKVTFRKGTGGTCSASTVGAAVTSSDLINSGSSQLICAEVLTPAPSTPPPTMYLHFKVQSVSSGAIDVKIDSVSFKAIGVLTLTPNNTGQVYPGGTVVYPHTLAASGSSSCTATTLNPIMDQALINLGWNALIYVDSNNNNALDAGDTLLGPAVGSGTPNYPMNNPLVPGTPEHLLAQVFAPNGAAVGATDLVTMTVSGSCAGATVTAVATDLTTVITGQVRLYKTQAVDATSPCNGTPDVIDANGNVTGEGAGAYGTGNITAKPGACVLYKVTAINEGTAPVNAVSIKDVTPVYSKYSSALGTAGCSGAGGVGTFLNPGDGVAGNVSCTWASPVAPGASSILDFEIKIDQ